MSTRRRGLLVVGLAVFLGGCSFQSMGRSFGHGAANGGVSYLEDPGTKARVRQVSDSLLAEIAASFQTQLRPTLDSTVAATLARGTEALGGAEDTLAAKIQGRLSGSLQDLVRTNIAAAGVEGRNQLDRTVRQLSQSVEQELTPVLRRSIVEATRALMGELSEGVRTQLASAAEAAVSGAVKAGVRTSSTEVQKTPAWKTLLWVAVGGVGSIVFLGIAWLVRERRRSLAALDVMASEIGRDAPALKSKIKARATERGVEGWLHEQLARKGHL